MSVSILENHKFIQKQVLASASASYDVDPIYAFDPSLEGRWASKVSTDWLQICFRTVTVKLTKYTYKTESNLENGKTHGSLKSWDFMASINGTNWELVDTVTSASETEQPNSLGEFSIQLENYYNCFRIVGKELWRGTKTEWTVINIGLFWYVKHLPDFIITRKQIFLFRILDLFVSIILS